MKSLTDVYDKVSAKDAELEKQAAVLIKQAEEEDAAGRITARGFADELAKLADANPFALSTPAQTGAGSAYGNTPGRQAQRAPRAPKVVGQGDTNAPGQAFNARKTKPSPIGGPAAGPGAAPKVSQRGPGAGKPVNADKMAF